MLKKCLIAIAVVALLVGTAQAANVKKVDGSWPSTYKALELCRFPVYMDVGYFVEIKDCESKEIKLVQVECPEGQGFPCYKGCVELEARANFPAIFGASLEKVGSVLADTSVAWTDDPSTIYIYGNQIPGDGQFYKLELCVEAWNTALWDSGAPDDKLLVGTMVITVKPPDDPG